MSSAKRITRSSKSESQMDLNKENPPSNQEEKIENSKKRGRKKGKKVISHDVTPTKTPLMLSQRGGRVLRSMSNGMKKSWGQNPNSEQATGTVTGTAVQEKVLSGKTRGRKPSKSTELNTIRNRVRNLVTRMNYEQNLIDAYSTDGWKGQSLEKLRPEKELDRAKTQIIKCKLRIRDSFKQLESVLFEGKLENSLFDSKGEIDCDDIFCAKCRSKNATLNNDIILCDGICDRGFHQNCLNPPLLTKDIPPGDEGWLCPACDCKVDCVELLNESQGIHLTLGDSWEKVFPEAAAAANLGTQYDPSDLPSDDSEDDDFDPDKITGEETGDDNGEENGDESEEGSEESSSDDSEFYTDSSEEENKKTSNKKAKNKNKEINIEALPSEDSDDDDFCEKEMSESDESDFSSDSDEFCDEIVKKSGGGDRMGEEMDSGDASVQGRRQEGPLDYNKLHQETFGKGSSDSSEDEDWLEKKRKKRGKALETSSNNSTKSPSTKSKRKSFGLDKNKTLKEYFETNQYPSHETKEILAEELGLTFQQVNKWFESARHHARSKLPTTPTSDPQISTGSKKRGRPTKNSSDIIARKISKCNNTTAEPVTPVSIAKPDKCPASTGVGPSNGATTSPMEFMDSERKKAILRELRKQKMGR